jgi:hypothetical protein
MEAINSAERHEIPDRQRAIDLDCKYRFAVPYERKCKEEADYAYGAISKVPHRNIFLLDISEGIGEHARALTSHLPDALIRAVNTQEELLADARHKDRISRTRKMTRSSVAFTLSQQGDLLESLQTRRRYNVITVLGDRILKFKTVEEVKRFIAQCATLLKPGGHLVIQMNEVLEHESESAKIINLKKNSIHITNEVAGIPRGALGQKAKKGEPVTVARDLGSGDALYYYYAEPTELEGARRNYNAFGLDQVESYYGHPIKVSRGPSGCICAYEVANGLEHRAIGKAFVRRKMPEQDMGVEYSLGFNRGKGWELLTSLLEKNNFNNISCSSSAPSADGIYRMVVFSAERTFFNDEYNETGKNRETVQSAPVEPARITAPTESDNRKQRKPDNIDRTDPGLQGVGFVRKAGCDTTRNAKYHRAKTCDSLPEFTVLEENAIANKTRRTPDWLLKLYPTIGKETPEYLAQALEDYRYFVLLHTEISAHLAEPATLSRLMNKFCITFFTERDKYFDPKKMDLTFKELYPAKRFGEKMKNTTVRAFFDIVDVLMQKHGLGAENIPAEVEDKSNRWNGIKQGNMYLFPVFFDLVSMGYRQGDLMTSL